MRKSLVKLLKCPNTGKTDFSVFGRKVLREGALIENIADQHLRDEDDVMEGLIFSTSSSTAYPVSDYIAILLSTHDVDLPQFKQLLTPYLENDSEVIRNTVKQSIASIEQQNETSHGKWNREEMKYYDEEVNSADKRNRMIRSIKTTPIWRIFLPRKRYIIQHLSKNIINKQVLEIGSGNSRTVANLLLPKIFNFNYIGTDVSFNRLQVAKAVIPEGDFIQASALNLPFKAGVFDSIISFGMLHHLPVPSEAIEGCATLLKPNGLFAFHEPIYRPKTNYPAAETFKQMVSTYEHSSHDGKIDYNRISFQLQTLNFDKESVVMKNTIVRASIESILKKLVSSFMSRRAAVRIMELMDELVLISLSRISKTFAPGTVYAVFKKKESLK